MSITQTLPMPDDRAESGLRRFLPYVLLIGLCFLTLIPKLDVYPAAWFDEGATTHAARTLIERGGYGTVTVRGYVPFDPAGISSGPPVIFPVALSFRLLGPGTIASRLPIALYAVLLVAGLYAIANKIYGGRAALFTTLLLLAVSFRNDLNILSLGRQSLGEVPALALVIIGLLLWFNSWDNNRLWQSALSGILIGMGLMSKMHFSLGLAPAIGLVALARAVQNRKTIPATFAGPVMTALLVGGWILLPRFVTPEPWKTENAAVLSEGMRVAFLSGLNGRVLSNMALAVAGVSGLAALMTLGGIARRPAGRRVTTTAAWAEVTLALFVLAYLAWFIVSSIGWLRYLFPAFVVAAFLGGKIIWDIFVVIEARLRKAAPALANGVYPAAIAAFMLVAAALILLPALRVDNPDWAQATGDYVRNEIPREAVVETWEWELDALSSHWNYHHPGQYELYDVVEQYALNQLPFALEYDTLSGDPDYLITGTYSDWTGIYPADVVDANFTPVATFGPYQVYERER